MASRFGIGWTSLRPWLAAGALALGASAAMAVPVTYTLTALNVTSRPDKVAAIGSNEFHDTFTVMTLTFVGDTDDVKPYTVNATSGVLIDKGTATVTLHDVSDNSHDVTATFDPGLIYVGNDPSRGIGFGSVIYPIYPFALFGDLVPAGDPPLDLKHDFHMATLGFGLTCVGIATSCQTIDTPAKAATKTLHTDKGDFWITWQGATRAVFDIEVQEATVPLPSTLLLAGLALAAGGVQRRRSSRAGKRA